VKCRCDRAGDRGGRIANARAGPTRSVNKNLQGWKSCRWLSCRCFLGAKGWNAGEHARVSGADHSPSLDEGLTLVGFASPLSGGGGGEPRGDGRVDATYPPRSAGRGGARAGRRRGQRWGAPFTAVGRSQNLLERRLGITLRATPVRAVACGRERDHTPFPLRAPHPDRADRVLPGGVRTTAQRPWRTRCQPVSGNTAHNR
jgi:hypothetical protein